jgi:hypothetical protein
MASQEDIALMAHLLRRAGFGVVYLQRTDNSVMYLVPADNFPDFAIG